MLINLLKCKDSEEQFEKLKEEREEVDEAFNGSDRIHFVSELWDEVQVLFTLIYEEVGNKRNFNESYIRHCLKLEKYDDVDRVKIVRKIKV